MSKIRPARDDDGKQVVKLVADCYAEYPGCVIDPLRELPVLQQPFSVIVEEKRGMFWVADHGLKIIGCVGWVPANRSGIELVKLYVAPSARRQGLGNELCQLVEHEALETSARCVELWSDTRFTDAHRLYENRGYRRGPQARELHDASGSVEYYFSKRLAISQP